jgi:hypothetical protein
VESLGRPSQIGTTARGLGRWLVLVVGCAQFGYEELSILPRANAGGSGGSATVGSPAGQGRGGSAGESVGAGGSGTGGGLNGAGGGLRPLGGRDASAPPGVDSGSDRDAGSTVDAGRLPTCTDALQNQNESDVDCGGDCAPCPCVFGAPELLGDPNLAGNDLLAVSFSRDALTMYIGGRIQGGNRPIATTTRPNRGNNFAFASLLAPVNSSPAVEGTPFLSFDELSLYFYSERAGGAGQRDLYVATRPNTGGNFNSLSALTGLNSNQHDQAPWLSPDELNVYFSSRRASAQDDLWRATRATRGQAFQAPVPVTELNSSGNDTGITFSADGLVVYFASDRVGGAGGLDLYRAARATPNTPFSTPEPVTALNTNADDASPQLTQDARELFFVSRRNGNDSQLFRVSANCP